MLIYVILEIILIKIWSFLIVVVVPLANYIALVNFSLEPLVTAYRISS